MDPQHAGETWLETFTRRVVTDALLEASARYWERRGDVLEDAAPKPDDYHGRATREELNAAWTRCMADARRCRLHAAIIRDDDILAPKYRDDIHRLHYDDPTWPQPQPIVGGIRDQLSQTVDAVLDPPPYPWDEGVAS